VAGSEETAITANSTLLAGRQLVLSQEVGVDAEDVVRLRRAVTRLARQLNTSATDEGLTPTQASVLALVIGHGPVTPTELARLEHVNPTMLSRVLGKLDEAELVHRSPDPDDLRSASLTATANGRHVHERIKAQRAAVMARGVHSLPKNEQKVLESALDALEHLSDELA
jgi:DNA-binding MarR family transcriptional regulator